MACYKLQTLISTLQNITSSLPVPSQVFSATHKILNLQIFPMLHGDCRCAATRVINISRAYAYLELFLKKIYPKLG